MDFDFDDFASKILDNEISVKQYKFILKTLWPAEPPPEPTIKKLCFVLSEITQTPVSYFESLTFLDIFLLFVVMRIYCFGPSLELSFTTHEEKKAKITLNLAKTIDSLKEIQSKHCTPKIIKNGDFTLTAELPSIKRMLEKKDADPLYSLFLTSITLQSCENDLRIDNNSLAQSVIDRLPPKITQELSNNARHFLQDIQHINLFSGYDTNESLLLSFNVESLIQITKLLFSEPLNTFYDNLFYLAHFGNMNPEFIERCTVGEYIYFINLLTATIEQKNSQQTQDAPFSESDFQLPDLE